MTADPWHDADEHPPEKPDGVPQSVRLRFSDDTETDGWRCGWSGWCFIDGAGLVQEFDDTERGLPTHWRIATAAESANTSTSTNG